MQVQKESIEIKAVNVIKKHVPYESSKAYRMFEM